MSRFWSWASNREVAASPSIAEEEQQPLREEVEIYTRERIIVAQVEANGQRLSDILNTGDELQIFDPQPYTYDGDLLPDEAFEGETMLNHQKIRFVMPPERKSPRQLRIHRRRRHVEVSFDNLTVIGSVHLSPGAELDPMAWRKQMSFVPLTEAQLLRDEDDLVEHGTSVVLVNLGPLEEQRKIEVS